ncbi:N-acetyltransferase [Acinetobacter qingfengensis]|uniref:GNAT family N-acetyltransferase n=1 Tax=Acinetobacter qingfengensis TaxID=1262585 RepID=A0A1E7R581_9GAMM|nr:GNAT family N-acetyltransferase [Acinetobacter qingfengensis]KAA8732467.1 N-acetyltransferase [Acinetobacter qingfengensis]OEY94462.1 GNAT family N-acetyltransferase [Acinetobacter qingfengensis]
MEIQHKNTAQRGEFFIHNNSRQKIAELTYFWNTTHQFSIDHTWVDPSLRGQGVAKQLFDAAIAFARNSHATIIPICSYAVIMFQRDQQLGDVLAKAI